MGLKPIRELQQKQLLNNDELEKYFSSEFCELTDFEKSEIAISIFKFTKLIFDQSK